MARRAKRAGPALAAASADPAAPVRVSATWAVGEVGYAGGVDAVEALGSLATDGTLELQRHKHIRAARDGEASEAMKQAACVAVLGGDTDKSAAVRAAAYTALEAMDRSILLAALRPELAERHPDGRPRIYETAHRLSNAVCISKEDIPSHDTPAAAAAMIRLTRLGLGTLRKRRPRRRDVRSEAETAEMYQDATSRSSGGPG